MKRIAAFALVVLALLAAFLASRVERRPTSAKPASARRIATASPALVEILYAIGAGDRIVGVSRFCRFPPEARALPQIGGMVDPSLAAIEALAPDCCLVQGASEKLEAFCSGRGIACERFTIETIADVLSTTSRLGELTGERAGAAREVARLTEQVALARASAPSPRPKVLLAFDHRPGELREVYVPGKATFLVECLEAAGGETVFPDVSGYRPVSREAILERAPEAIVELRSDETSPEVEAALVADWKNAFPEVPAVRNGRVRIVADDAALIPGPRLDRIIAKMASALRDRGK